MKKRIRQWAIKHNLIKPATLRESQELFKFPVKLKPQIERISICHHLTRIL